MGIKEDIKQMKPFKDEFQKAQINVAYTASWLGQNVAQVLKPYNISIQQFNILRILRGCYPEYTNVGTITERMVDRSSNTSRLLDKLNKKGLIDRLHCPTDRRQVHILITQAGLDLLEQASQSIDEWTGDMGKVLTIEEATLLNKLLDKIREM